MSVRPTRLGTHNVGEIENKVTVFVRWPSSPWPKCLEGNLWTRTNWLPSRFYFGLLRVTRNYRHIGVVETFRLTLFLVGRTILLRFGSGVEIKSQSIFDTATRLTRVSKYMTDTFENILSSSWLISLLYLTSQFLWIIDQEISFSSGGGLRLLGDLQSKNDWKGVNRYRTGHQSRRCSFWFVSVWCLRGETPVLKTFV